MTGSGLWLLRIVAVASIAVCLVVVIADVVSASPSVGVNVLNAANAILFMAVGWLLTERRPGNAVGPLLFVFGAFYAWYLPADLYLRLPGDPPGAAFAAMFASMLDAPMFVVVALVLILFPDGRLPSARWWPVPWLGAVSITLTVIGAMLDGGALPLFPEFHSPLSIPGFPGQTLIYGSYVVMMVLLVLGAFALGIRWRRGHASERAQIKWVAAAGLVLLLAEIVNVATFRTSDPTAFTQVLVLFAIALLPVAIGVAVLRYRLYAIDRIVSRGIAYGVVTALLGATFIGIILAMQWLLSPFTQEQTIAVAVSTLVVFALFQPVRRRVQGAVDRRFDRARYDADQTVRTFAARLRGDLDLVTVRGEIIETASAAVPPGDGRRVAPWDAPMIGARAFASVGVIVAVSAVIGTVIVRSVAPAPFLVTVFGFDGVVMVGFLIEGVSWTAVGAVLLIRRPGNAVGWLMIPVGAGYALSMLASALTFAFVADGSATGAGVARYAGWATVLFQLVGMLLLAIGFVFPTGRLQSRRWAWFIWLYVAFGGVFVVLSLTQPGPLQLIPSLENPFGIGPDLRGDRPFAPILAAFAPVLVGGLVVSMVTRYRHADRVERQQLKWFVLALSASAFGLAIVTLEAVVLARPVDAVGLTIHVFGGTLVPVAIGIAILRHHLYDIDRIVSRTIGYAIVTASLAAVFALAALLLGAVLGAQGAGETFQVAGATLLVFALFGRVRRRVQTAVDRRFDRSHYDAQRTAAAFAERLRSDLDLGTVRGEIVQTASAAMRPTTAAVWLRGGTK